MASKSCSWVVVKNVAIKKIVTGHVHWHSLILTSTIFIVSIGDCCKGLNPCENEIGDLQVMRAQDIERKKLQTSVVAIEMYWCMSAQRPYKNDHWLSSEVSPRLQ